MRDLIDSMQHGDFSDRSGVEKEVGIRNGILVVYQNVVGTELVNLYLEFLSKNKHLVVDSKQIISDRALVAITLMIAQSRPKETMVKLVMNFLSEKDAKDS